LSSLLEEEPDDDEEEESLSEDELSESEDEAAFAYASSSAYFFSKRSFGAFLRNSLRLSVRAPRPILVKKLIEKRAF
jgi:hypothetical protein